MATNELLVGIEHSLLPEFVIGANLTWRRAGDYYDTIPIYEDANGNTKLLGLRLAFRPQHHRHPA